MSKPAQSRKTRELVLQTPGGQRSPLPLKTTNPGADCAKDYEQKRVARHGGLPVCGWRRVVSILIGRLSATDISALASMKNVAKCDTWCELQNPVNHRVFERKLRPKPSGQGHVCLGVTHRVAPQPFQGAVGGDWPPVRSKLVVGLNTDPVAAKCRDDWWCTSWPCAVRHRVATFAPLGCQRTL